jgi:hypothetical protein
MGDGIGWDVDPEMDQARAAYPVSFCMKSSAWGALTLVGLFYALVGILFAWPVEHVRVWRLAAWVVSAVAYAAHIGYECFRLHSAPRRAALHVAAAVALGALGLAAGANLHSLSMPSTSGHRRLLLIALAAWPAITAVPAFLVALAAATMLSCSRFGIVK